MPLNWSYSASARLDETDAPAVSFLEDEVLPMSAIVREVHAWFSEHKEPLNLSAVGQPHLVQDRCITLGILPSIAATFTFDIGSSGTTRSTSSTHGPSALLRSQLLAQAPVPLHFTLSLQVRDLLGGLAEELARVHPSTFNAVWIRRLSNEAEPRHSMATSLTRILGLAPTPSAEPSLLDSRDHLKAQSLYAMLSERLGLAAGSAPDDIRQVAAGSALTQPAASTGDPIGRLETALAVIAEQPAFIDSGGRILPTPSSPRRESQSVAHGEPVKSAPYADDRMDADADEVLEF
ncbi:hypothetical protein JCM10212_000633 [Sporobolomyces blumeae]